MHRQPKRKMEADPAVVAQMQAALEAELNGKPKRWFLLCENPRGGLKLGIGMFNPGICRVADMCYHGELSPEIVTHANLIAAATNACREVNPHNPIAAATEYQRIITACQNVVALEMCDAQHIPTVRAVIELVAQALEQARRVS